MNNHFIKWVLVLIICFVSCKKDNDDSQSPSVNNPIPVPVPTAIGSTTGLPFTMNIDNFGGTIISPDGLFELIIPPGAVNSTTAFTIQQITNECHGGITNTAYRLSPDGFTFTNSVTLLYHYTPSAISGTDPFALGFAFQKGDGTWTSFTVMQTDTASKTIATQVDHFTDFAIFTDWKIEPASADVPTKSEKLLTVMHQERNVDPDEPEQLAPLVGTFEPATNYTGSIKNWCVNGIAIGNVIDGYLVPSNPTATFHAPDEIPGTNPAAVSVEIEVPGRPKMFLVSNLNITATGHYRLEIKDNQLLNGVICYCQIPVYSDVSTIEFYFDNNNFLVPGATNNIPPVFSYISIAPGICTTVTSTIGTVQINNIYGNLTANSMMDLTVSLMSEVPGVTSTMMGTPCDSPVTSSSSNLNISQFNTTDSVQTFSTPLGTQITLTKLD